MFSVRSLVFYLVCYTVSGLKLSEKSAQFENIELQEKTNTRKDQNIFWEKYMENKQVNMHQKLSNKSVMHMDNLNIWNPSVVAKIWNRDAPKLLNISADCENDITNYLAAVSTGELWALKMIDATGRYVWNLFSGNVFWLGGVDQCREMERKFIEWQKNGKPYHQENIPPFLVSMTSVTLNLSIYHAQLNETYRIIHGICLPDSCSIEDTEKLLHFAHHQFGNDSLIKITIENVRNLSKGYLLSEDPVFYVLLVTFTVVVLFVVLGTFYDISLRYQVLITEKKGQSMRIMSTEMKSLASGEPVEGEITMAKLWSVKKHNGSLDVRNLENVPKPLSEALLSFSLLLNLSKVFSLDVGADTLAPIHGLRFLSMIWIILVHTCLTMNVISEGQTFKSTAEKDFLYQTISNSTYSVDTFFFMSGCLVSFLYFRTITKDDMKKKKIIRGTIGQILQFLGMIWYRYFRLTPVYLLVIGLIEVSMSWYYSHTMLDLYTLDYENCRKFWWRNALYINTYFPMGERCIVWSWYLANDTLFYIVGTIILIIGARFLKFAAFLTIAILIVSWITTTLVALNVDHVPSIHDPFAHYESLYDKPWSRIGPYLFGMMAGWYLYKSDCKIKINKIIALLFWAFSFALMLCIVYGLYGDALSPFLGAIYTAFSHSAWAVAIGWILIACVTGHGGVINQILSWKCLYPLSRLTYCAYLVHPAIIRAVALHGESSMHLTQGLMAILFLGFTVASYAASLFISLFFEAPMVSLLRIVHPLRQWKKNK